MVLDKKENVKFVSFEYKFMGGNLSLHFEFESISLNHSQEIFE